MLTIHTVTDQLRQFNEGHALDEMDLDTLIRALTPISSMFVYSEIELLEWFCANWWEAFTPVVHVPLRQPQTIPVLATVPAPAFHIDVPAAPCVE
jgi:hypothetical protein